MDVMQITKYIFLLYGNVYYIKIKNCETVTKINLPGI